MESVGITCVIITQYHKLDEFLLGRNQNTNNSRVIELLLVLDFFYFGAYSNFELIWLSWNRYIMVRIKIFLTCTQNNAKKVRQLDIPFHQSLPLYRTLLILHDDLKKINHK